MKKTLVLGSSTNPERYSFKAITMLREFEHPVEAIGLKKGEVAGVSFETELLPFEGVDTVTLYLNPKRQVDYYSYILSLKPQRVLFNPGTENEEFYALLDAEGISHVEACTLVLLRTGQY